MTQKKICFTFFILMAGVFLQTSAQTVEVSALNSFSTAEPPASISVKLEGALTVSESNILEAGTILSGNLFDVVSPKRLKRNASFSFKPTMFTDLNGEKHSLDLNLTASYTKPVDKSKLAVSAVKGVGNHFVKGLSMGVAVVEGAVKNEEGNRLKSSANSLYEASPLSLVERGEDLYIQADEHFFLKFSKPKKENNNDYMNDKNDSTTIEKE
ncbi:MAG: hypothetical protein NC191_03695 [Muribaculaceae bacterium]|nr:hypothetical protein [Muribaculaceae bacterium]